MKNTRRIQWLLTISALLVPACIFAQDGSIDFVARAMPSAGVEEPVRGLPFYLLSKSFEEIRKEARSGFPGPDMNAFIDQLEVSPELKAWMKKNHWIRLSGEDFVKMLKVDDIMGIPEFFAAYVARMSGDQTVNFPTPKYKASEKTKDPAKYQKLKDEYYEAVRRFLENNPKSTQGMDLNLEETDPSNKWNQLQQKDLPELQRQTMALAQSKYLVARAETDVQGQGYLRGIPPGTYWLSNLDVAARVGDAQLRWDVPVSVRPGKPTYVSLSNANSVAPSRHSQ